MAEQKGNRKKGPRDHFTGQKREFLVSKAAVFQLALDSKGISIFYNDIANAFIEQFGLEEPFSQELVEIPGLTDPNDNPPDVVIDVDVPARVPLTPDEVEALTKKLRKVSGKSLFKLLCHVLNFWFIYRNSRSGTDVTTCIPDLRVPKIQFPLLVRFWT
jgi:hypothetical protein